MSGERRTARIHIGPVKTGTTTVQEMLAADRSRLRRHGYLYPTTPRGENGHLTAAVDFLRCFDGPTSPQGRFEMVSLAQFPAWRMGTWQRLVDEVRTDRAADVVISSEILCRFSKDMAAAVMTQIPAEHHQVVIVSRKPSSLLPSWYQEEIKRGWLPDFGTYARDVIAKLASPAPSEFDFLDGANLQQAWQQAGAEVLVIDAWGGLHDEVIEATVAALTPGMSWQAPRDAANASMSAVGVNLWRQHLAASPPVFLGAAHEVRNRMLAAFPATATGPQLRLLPDVAEALDAYVSGELVSFPQFDEYALATPETDFDYSEALRQMASWQRMADAKWRTLDAASRLSRRGPLMRSRNGRW